jgi:hypothetical protein
MQQGELFTMYQDPDGLRVPVNVTYNAANGRAGTLSWAEEGQPTTPEQSLGLHEVSDIYLGQQRRVFQMSEAGVGAAEATEDCCFSVVGRHSVLDVQGESAEQVRRWVLALTYVLTCTGSQVLLEEEGPAEGSADGAFSRRRFSVSPYAIPANLAQPLATSSPSPVEPASGVELSSHASVIGLVSGADFMLMSADGDTANQITLSLAFDGSVSGSLFWSFASEPVTRSPDRCIPLHTFSDICIGKEATPLQGKVSRGSAEEACLSLVADSLSLHLVAPDATTATNWVQGLNLVLTSTGNTVVDEFAGTMDEGKRFSISGVAVESDGLPFSGPAAQVLPDGPGCAKAMERGIAFTLYTDADTEVTPLLLLFDTLAILP